MTELLWQSTLLVALAFFFGAVFACGLKRRFYYGPSTKASAVAVSGVSHAPSADQPKIEVASRAAPEGERFERAISGQSASTAAAMAAPIVAPPKPAAPAAPTPKAAPAPTPPRHVLRLTRRGAAGAAHIEHFRDDRFRRTREARGGRRRA